MVAFNESKKSTLGVEIELQIIDAHSCDLSPQSEKILSLCRAQGLQCINSEIHQSMIEVNSAISDTVKQCRDDLANKIVALNDIVESQGLNLTITGTHPFQCWQDRLISNEVRYQNLHEKFQWLARRMNIYGMHVHIGVASKDRAINICNQMIPYLPHLLALSANSPYWRGIDTGMQSSRINIMDAFPFSGLPLYMRKWKQFEQYYATLHKAGAIKTFKDLYWYVRPHLLYGTVEVRICDAMSSLKDTMAVVALIQCLTNKINAELDEQPTKKFTQKHYWIAPENQWTAARDGLEGVIVVDFKSKKLKISEAILDLVEQLSPIAKNLNCFEELQHIREIIRKGNGAARQRMIYKETESLEEVVRLTNKEFKENLFALHDSF